MRYSASAASVGAALIAVLGNVPAANAQWPASAVNVTPGDGFLDIDWAISVPGGDASLRTFIGKLGHTTEVLLPQCARAIAHFFRILLQ